MLINHVFSGAASVGDTRIIKQDQSTKRLAIVSIAQFSDKL
jgi:hypothetical protein